MGSMDMERVRSGVSPLIASVLLIAFTMAVAAILTAWVTQFTQQQTETLGNESSDQIDCSFAQLEIQEAVAGDSNVTVSVTNMGTVELDVIMEAFDDGSVAASLLPEDNDALQNLTAGVTTSIGIGTGDEDSVRVSSPQCPQVEDTANVQ